MSFSYTDQNHFSWSYDGVEYADRTAHDQQFSCRYGRAREILDLRTANMRAARSIADSIDSNIVIMMSGGADSEVTAQSFLDAGVTFSAAILRYCDGANDHDIRYAEEWCRHRNIAIKHYDLNYMKLWMSPQFTRWSREDQCNIFSVLSTFWLMDQITDLSVIGQGEPYLFKQGSDWYFRESENFVSWYKHARRQDKTVVPGFHQYTPEQMLATLLDPLTQEMIYVGDVTCNDQIKHKLYKSHYPDVRYRPKQTGTEHLIDKMYRAKDFIGDNLTSYPFLEYRMEYHSLVDQLKP